MTPRWITDDELAAQPELVRTMSVKPPTGAGRVRLMEIAGPAGIVDLQPCGGTHVRNTAEIGPVAVDQDRKQGPAEPPHHHRFRRVSEEKDSAMPYAHPEALVGTEWLAAHLDDPQVRVVDCSFKLPGITPTARRITGKGHIPGAVFFDIDDIAAPGTSLPHMIPSADLFAQKIGALGIGDGDRIVVYDGNGLSSAGRAWWMLRLFGHRDVALLDGGLPKWQAEGRPVDTAIPARRRAVSPRDFDAGAGARQGGIARQTCASRARAGGRCPRRRPLRRHRAEARPGPAQRPYPKEPQPAL